MRGSPNRWLDLRRLSELLLTSHQVNRIRYFTARVTSRADDPTQAQRQQAYLRALSTVPDLSIHYGHLLAKRKRRPLVAPSPSGPRTVEVLDTEEKGSDVNLASFLLVDGFEDDYDLAVLISNDSDLELPISMVRDRLGKTIGVFDPSRRRSFQLSQAASWYRPLRQGALRGSQFPDVVSDSQGAISKPPGW